MENINNMVKQNEEWESKEQEQRLKIRKMAKEIKKVLDLKVSVLAK